MAGRKPKPTAVKKLEGNPGKRKLNNKELDPKKRMPACPDWLMPEAKKEWERLAELMNQMDVLTEADMAAFAAYCQSYVRWKEAQEHITSGGSTFEIDIELEIKREGELRKGQTASFGRYKNVILSEKEFAELQEELPGKWEYYIDRLSGYIVSSGKKYKNHVATIRRWAADDKAKGKPKKGIPDYSCKEGESL